jgi:hypothetical protein
MTFPAIGVAVLAPAVAALAPPLEPEPAIAKPPTPIAIAAVPAAIDLVSLRLLKIRCLRLMVVHLLGGGWKAVPTLRPEP